MTTSMFINCFTFMLRYQNINPGVMIFFLILLIILKLSENKFDSVNYVDKSYFTDENPAFFKQNLAPKQKHIMSAYFCLARHLLKKDMVDTKLKITYIRKHFQRKFPEHVYSFNEYLSFHLKTPHDLKSVCKWFTTKTSKKEDRIQLLQFLTGISMIDGMLNHSENKILREICIELQRDQNDLNDLISIYTRKEGKKETTTLSHNHLNKYYETLSISSDSNADEIKRAYRRLVMENHPDKFENAGKEQMELAKERFLKIQEAYEYLEERMMR